VKAVFAGTFYWIALSHPADPRYQDALDVERQLAGAKIFTTEEVLAEFLTFFRGDAWLRERASRAVQGLFDSPDVQVIPQSHESFMAGLELILPGSTKVIA
jgi:uncharacterized protein